MTDSLGKMDVLVDVAPGITVFRRDGKWDMRVTPPITREAALRELAFQCQRISLRASLLKEALEGLSTLP